MWNFLSDLQNGFGGMHQRERKLGFIAEGSHLVCEFWVARGQIQKELSEGWLCLSANSQAGYIGSCATRTVMCSGCCKQGQPSTHYAFLSRETFFSLFPPPPNNSKFCPDQHFHRLPELKYSGQPCSFKLTSVIYFPAAQLKSLLSLTCYIPAARVSVLVFAIVRFLKWTPSI